jgi:hypothetical protein
MNHIQLFEDFGKKTEIDFSKIDNVEMDGIDYSDAPDFADAYIASCDIDGRPATDEELDIINSDSEFVFSQLEKYLY